MVTQTCSFTAAAFLSLVLISIHPVGSLRRRLLVIRFQVEEFDSLSGGAGGADAAGVLAADLSELGDLLR